MIVALAAIAAALAFVVARGSSSDERVAVPPGPPAVVGGHAAERALAARLLSGFGPHRRIVRVAFGIPPRGFARRGNGRWLTITVAGADAVTARVHAEWQADAFAGAMRRSARSEALPRILGFTRRVVSFPAGDVVETGSGVLGLETPKRDRQTRRELVRVLEAAAAGANVEVERTWFIQLDHPAIAARLVTADAEAFVCEADRRLIALTEGFVDGSHAVAGVYLDVREEDGDPVLAFGNGYIRVRDDLGERYPPETVDPGVRERYYELCSGRPPTPR